MDVAILWWKRLFIFLLILICTRDMIVEKMHTPSKKPRRPLVFTYRSGAFYLNISYNLTLPLYKPSSHGAAANRGVLLQKKKVLFSLYGNSIPVTLTAYLYSRRRAYFQNTVNRIRFSVLLNQFHRNKAPVNFKGCDNRNICCCMIHKGYSPSS